MDDFGIFADALGALLAEDPRFKVTGVGRTASDARALVRDGAPDVLLLDYHLPGGPADDVIREVAAGSTRVVVLTSDTSSHVRRRAIACGAAGFVTKDRSIDHVVDALEQAIGSG